MDFEHATLLGTPASQTWLPRATLGAGAFQVVPASNCTVIATLISTQQSWPVPARRVAGLLAVLAFGLLCHALHSMRLLTPFPAGDDVLPLSVSDCVKHHEVDRIFPTSVSAQKDIHTSRLAAQLTLSTRAGSTRRSAGIMQRYSEEIAESDEDETYALL